MRSAAVEAAAFHVVAGGVLEPETLGLLLGDGVQDRPRLERLGAAGALGIDHDEALGVDDLALAGLVVVTDGGTAAERCGLANAVLTDEADAGERAVNIRKIFYRIIRDSIACDRMFRRRGGGVFLGGDEDLAGGLLVVAGRRLLNDVEQLRGGDVEVGRGIVGVEVGE